jgi:hypothetical protein
MNFFVFHWTVCGPVLALSKSSKVFDKDSHIHRTIRIRIYVALNGVNPTYMHVTQGYSVTIPTSRFHMPLQNRLAVAER